VPLVPRLSRGPLPRVWTFPDTRTDSTDVEVTPQDCVAPGELKVVFCPTHDCSSLANRRHH
jgi:hypothetical protein